MSQLKLTVEIIGLRNSNGKIHLELSNSEEIRITGITKQIIDGKCQFVFENLKPDRYAFKFFHDENKNNKIDVNWLGIPKEGFGFSNNPSMTFGPPSFEKTIFVFIESMVIMCTPKYF